MQTLIMGIICVGAGVGIIAAYRRAADFTQQRWAKQLDARFADTEPIYFRVYAVFFGVAMVAAGLIAIFVVEA